MSKTSFITVVDLETTGFDAPEHAPIEIGWHNLAGRFCNMFWDPDPRPNAILVAPGRDIPPESSAIHHLIDADVSEALPWRDAFAGFARQRPIAYAAHNAKFERQWLEEFTGDVPWICTWKCALRAWPEAPQHSNQALRYWLNPVGLNREVARVTHRAGPDAYVTAFLLRELLAQHSFETLVQWSEEPATLIRVPFGKTTNGMRWTEVDDYFLDWVLARDFDADVLFTARIEVKRRANERAVASFACVPYCSHCGAAGQCDNAPERDEPPDAAHA